jgi:hypothetical protein
MCNRFTSKNPSTPGKEALILVRQEVGWAREPVWMLWWGGKFPVPVGNRTTDFPASSPVLLKGITPNSFHDWNSSNINYGCTSYLNRVSESHLHCDICLNLNEVLQFVLFRYLHLRTSVMSVKFEEAVSFLLKWRLPSCFQSRKLPTIMRTCQYFSVIVCLTKLGL